MSTTPLPSGLHTQMKPLLALGNDGHIEQTPATTKSCRDMSTQKVGDDTSTLRLRGGSRPCFAKVGGWLDP